MLFRDVLKRLQKSKSFSLFCHLSGRLSYIGA